MARSSCVPRRRRHGTRRLRVPIARGFRLPRLAAGHRSQMVVPRPSALSISMAAPWARTMSSTMAIPKPVPPARSLVEKKGSKIFSRRSGGIPQPVSSTRIVTQGCGVRPRLIRNRPSAGGRRGAGISVACGQSNLPARGCGIEGVCDQVEEHLL